MRSREVGALVAWMVYAGFWTHASRTAGTIPEALTLALLGFALVIFTWLGVSFIIPGFISTRVCRNN